MDLHMNVEAAQRFITDLLPRIRNRLEGMDVRFLIIGREPSPSLTALVAATPGVSLSGTVDDIVPWVQKLDILVAPLRVGAGTKLKVAEAMSCGVPVVGSSLAFAGLPGQSGEHYVRVDGDAEFVSVVCRLAQEPEDRAALGRSAREFTQAHLEWDAIGHRLAEDVQGGLSDRRRRSEG
jgi:glycosyltransferase involved in cell wall biosynthesis